MLSASRRTKPSTAKPKTFLAPTRGWVKNENLAAPTPGGASVMDNWFPTATGCRMRGGQILYATIDGTGVLDTVSLFSYSDGNNRHLWAASETDIYEITTIVDPEVSPAAVISGQTSGFWIACQFETSGGAFLRIVNGEDTPQVFDGVTWSTLPAITGPSSASDLNYVWSFKNRLFFNEKDTLDAWYLPVDTIGGAATKFSLGSVFTMGGSLLWGASWSLDQSTGLDAYCVFVSDQGEIAVYGGTDPGSASTWALQGLYKMGVPLGPQAFIRAGGDLIVATEIGFLPLSQAVQRDIAALAPAAASYVIEDAWNQGVERKRSESWHCEVWPSRQWVVVALPTLPNTESEWFVANSRTGAWGRFTGWDCKCIELFNDQLFYGSTAGKILSVDITGADIDLPYTASLVPLFEDFGDPASMKIASLARAVLRAPAPVIDSLSILMDYNETLPTPPDSVIATSQSVWGAGRWGIAIWTSELVKNTYAAWRSVSGAGTAIAPCLQITSGDIVPPNVEVVRIDVIFETAGIVT